MSALVRNRHVQCKGYVRFNPDSDRESGHPAQRVRDAFIDRAPSHNLTELANELDRDGYHPGKSWAPSIVLTRLVAGPMLALGLFTRLAELRTLASGWIFLEQDKRELTLLWTVSTLFFLLHGGGAIAVDHLLISREF